MRSRPSKYIQGVYANPQAVVASPAYAERLVVRNGVNTFVLRAGFAPESSPPRELESAVEIVHGLGAEAWFLVGAWWGEGIDPGTNAMVSASPWAHTRIGPSHEARWRMHTPGGHADAVIEARLRDLVSHYGPDGICMTHARFRHPADIPGLFEFGSGPFADYMANAGVTRRQLAEATGCVDAALFAATPEHLAEFARDRQLPAFLDATGGTTVFSTWFAARAQVVERSLDRFRQAVLAEGPEHVLFGTNAYAPFGAQLCGQDYLALTNFIDFLQPLLGYVRWHILQPVEAWTAFLRERVHGLDEVAARKVSAHLLGLPPSVVAFQPSDRDPTDEGSRSLVESVVTNQLIEARRTTTSLLPVIRGQDWQPETVEVLAGLVRDLQCAGIVYQGTGALAGTPPGPGWQ